MKKRKKRFSLLLKLVILVIALCFLRSMALNHCQLAYKNEILKYSEENNIEPYFLAAIIKTESNFNEKASSGKGALGLMQITENTEIWISKRLGEEYKAGSVLDADTSIKYGSWYVRYLIDRYKGNQNLAVLAYNAGYVNVDRWVTDKKITGRFLEFKAIPFEETRNYLIKTRIYTFLYKYLYDWKS